MVSYGDADPAKDALVAQVKLELEEIRKVLRKLDFEAVSRKIASYPLRDQVAQATRIKDALKAILE